MNFHINYKFVVAGFLMIISSFGLLSQQQDTPSSDLLESWNALEANYEVSDKINLNAEAQFRLKSFGNTYNQAFVEFQTVYAPWKFLEFGLGYRNIDKLDDKGKKQGHENFHRYHAFVQGNTSVGRADFGVRVQHQTKREVGSLTGPKDNSYWRTKLNFKYNIRNWKLDPRIGMEFFMQDQLDPKNSYDKFRFSLGTKLKFKKRKSLLIKYQFEKEVHSTNPIQSHVLSLRYGLSLKPKTPVDNS